MQTQWRLPLTALVLAITNRATTLHSQNEMDKDSNRNSVRVLAWCLACIARKRINENLFGICLFRVRLTARFPRSLRSLVMTRVGTPTPERKLIRSVLIHGMCPFRVRAARRREKRTPNLTDSTSDCAILLRSRRTKRSGITRGRYLSM